MKPCTCLLALIAMGWAFNAAAASAAAPAITAPETAPAAAPEAAANGDPEPWMVTERARIVRERATAMQEFAVSEKACWQKFAVNDCLRRAQLARRDQVDLLRRQEWVLNDMERRLRTQARLKGLEEKQQQN